MKSFLISILVCIFIVATGFPTVAEELSAEEKEVWNAVLADYEIIKTGDAKKLMAPRHKDFVGWFFNQQEVMDKVGSESFYKGWFGYDIPAQWELELAKVLIMDNVANVYYSYQYKGAVLTGKGRVVETLVKKGGKWFMISHICASCDSPVSCK